MGSQEGRDPDDFLLIGTQGVQECAANLARTLEVFSRQGLSIASISWKGMYVLFWFSLVVVVPSL